jgi:MtN3 and saliva related transmembrane protein
MSGTLLLGFIAASCSTLAFLPQVIKAWRTRSTRDISLVTFLTIAVGSVFWVVYGWLEDDPPVLVTNAIIFVLASIILWLKLRWSQT